MKCLPYGAQKALVIYHADCLDGMGAALCAWKVFGDNAEYLPADYDHLPPLDRIESDTVVYILDFSYETAEMVSIFAKARHVVWLDHHDSARKRVEPIKRELVGAGKLETRDYEIWFEDNHSGAYIAFQHFFGKLSLPIPRLISIIEDWDYFRFSLPETKDVCAALNSYPMDFPTWDRLLDGNIESLREEGVIAHRLFRKDLADLLKTAYPVELNGVKGKAVNAPKKFASDLGHELAKETGTYGLVWQQLPGNIKVSLRSLSNFNVSDLAVKFGGGGHKQASGFFCQAPVWR